MENKKFARVEDFSSPRYLRYLGFDRVEAKSIGAKYEDKYGKTNRLTFKDLETGEEQILENTSFLFLNDFKSARLRSGDSFILVSIKFDNPEIPERSFRRWIFQKVSSTPKPEISPQKAEATTDEIAEDIKERVEDKEEKVGSEDLSFLDDEKDE